MYKVEMYKCINGSRKLKESEMISEKLLEIVKFKQTNISNKCSV